MPTATKPNQAIQFLVPLSARRKATDEEGGGDWIPMVPIGRWVSHHFWHVQGIYEISAQNIQEMDANHKRGIPPIDISGNVQHDFGSASVGWVQEVRPTPTGLEVRVQWTPLGERLLAEDAFRYVSPEWWDLGRPYVVSETGQSIPWVFDGFGLTNTPFFTDLPGLVAERMSNGVLVCAPPLTAVWEETDKEIRHRVRDPGDFRDDTFRTKKLSSSAVRAVEVSFDISDAMAGGVSMIVGKLKEENVPEGNDANSMVLQAMRFARKTEDQDGWTSAQAKSWFAKSSFSKGEAAMSAVEPLTAGATAAPAAVVPTAPDAALTAERDRLAADNARLTADAAKAKRETDLAALKARFAGVKLPGKRVFAPAHASALADTAIEIAEDKREAHVLATIAALEHGQVEEGERGGSSPAQSGNLNHALFAAASRFAIGREYVYMANVRAGGGRIDVAAARQAVAQMGPLAASGVEIPSLSYQETMVLIESMFLAGYEEIPSLTSMFCNRVSRSTRTVDYRALGAPPRMREFFDERQHAVMNTKTPFPVTVRDWEASVAIPASEFQADLLGDYALAMQQMGGFAKQHPDELVAALIVAAETTLCYDGQNLCDTDHGEADSGTQSNFLTTGGDDDEIADVEADLNAGIAAMQRFKDDRGNNMRIGTMPNAVWDIVCRPEAYPTFNKLATATEISGTSNGWKGRLRITSLPDLTAADEWYLIYAGGIRKPLIVQFQNEPDALTILGADSEYCKINMKLLFMTQGNYTVAPADWRYILKVQKA